MWRALPTSRSASTSINGNLKYSHVFVGAYRRDGTVDSDVERQMHERAKIEMPVQLTPTVAPIECTGDVHVGAGKILDTHTSDFAGTQLDFVEAEQNDEIENSEDMIENDLSGPIHPPEVEQNGGAQDEYEENFANHRVGNLSKLDDLEHCDETAFDEKAFADSKMDESDTRNDGDSLVVDQVMGECGDGVCNELDSTGHQIVEPEVDQNDGRFTAFQGVVEHEFNEDNFTGNKMNLACAEHNGTTSEKFDELGNDAPNDGREERLVMDDGSIRGTDARTEMMAGILMGQ